MSDQGNENSEQPEDAIDQRRQSRGKRKFNERLVQNSEQPEDAMDQRRQTRRKRSFNEPFVRGSTEYILAKRVANHLMEVLVGPSEQEEPVRMDEPVRVDEPVRIEDNRLVVADSLSLGDHPIEYIASGSGTKDGALICEDGNEEIDVSMRKKEFMRFETNCKDKNRCVRCNKGGMLLVCGGDSCPVIVHEECLGDEASFYNDVFLCPFCFYSFSVSERKAAKKRLDIARLYLLGL